MKIKMVMVWLSSLSLVVGAGEMWSQASFEDRLYGMREGEDDLDNLTNEDVPQCRKDALSERFGDFIHEGGWSTNRVIGALILSVTNCLGRSAWASERDHVIAAIAFNALSEINHPRSLAFVMQTCTNDVRDILNEGVTGVFRYSQYEPEVFDYLRKLCVMTNRYEGVVRNVALDLEDCLGGVLEGNRCAATNQLARYHYFVIRHATARVGLVDHLLSNLLPSYSNSIQRLNAMRYVANTATNRDQAVWATNQVNRLSALPTNQLNNVSWLEE